MKPKHIFPAALLSAVFTLSGCAAGLYEAKSWTSPGGEAVTADWDVASAKCEAEAIEEEASEGEKAAAQTVAKSGVEMSNTLDSLSGSVPNPGIGLLGGALIGALPHAMDESAKNDKFIECMKKLDWKQAEKE